MGVDFKKIVDETVNTYAPMQVYEELLHLTTFLAERTLINALEIGSHRCGILNILAHIVVGKIISVDSYHHSAEAYRQRFSLSHPRAKLIKGNSHDEHVKELVVQFLGKEMIDLLLIDADHTTMGIFTDVNMYSPLVARGGMIVVHDVDPQHALLSEPEVAWCALKQDPRFKSEEIICLGNTPGINYADKGQLSQITDMLYFDPVRFKKQFPKLNGLPHRLGGFGILCKLDDIAKDG
jgi:predicted O-methyltransferase YrrM